MLSGCKLLYLIIAFAVLFCRRPYLREPIIILTIFNRVPLMLSMFGVSSGYFYDLSECITVLNDCSECY